MMLFVGDVVLVGLAERLYAWSSLLNIRQIAQLVEHQIDNLEVVGSIPTLPTNYVHNLNEGELK